MSRSQSKTKKSETGFGNISGTKCAAIKVPCGSGTPSCITPSTGKVPCGTPPPCGTVSEQLGQSVPKRTTNRKPIQSTNKLPQKIEGSYHQDYNIIYIDQIIRQKLAAEKLHIDKLEQELARHSELILQPQTFLARSRTLKDIEELTAKIEGIKSGEKLTTYEQRAEPLLNAYRKSAPSVKSISFDDHIEFDDNARNRLMIIDEYLTVASEYITLNIIRLNDKPNDECMGCNMSLTDVVTNEDGTKRCPTCYTEHNVIMLSKMSKDGSRINTTNSTDESIDNFIRAFIRYQGLQPDKPPESLYTELDAYFVQLGRPTGAEIRELPLNDKGRRGDTTHRMLWTALSQISRSEYYEDTNLIGHIYWGWTLNNISEYRDLITNHYLKTQKVFYQIPSEERGRNSSLGTQYRLWRHLQLVGYPCSIDEFKIAENPESLRIHHRLWKLMCEGTGDPDIKYIP